MQGRHLVVRFCSKHGHYQSEWVLLDLVKYEHAVLDIWKRNYRALSVRERPLHCVPSSGTAEPLVVFAKGDEAWKEQNVADVLAALEARPSADGSYDMKKVLLATTAMEGVCTRIYDLYENTLGPDEALLKRLKHVKMGPNRDLWNQRKMGLWREACMFDAKLREAEG